MSSVAIDLDAPEATIQHSEMIRSKRFLREIYLEHYRYFAQQLAEAPQGIKVELGSGGGFIQEILPEAITSDVVPLPTVKLVMSGLSLPFADQSVSGIMMINVLHHLQNVEAFFREARRVLLPGGRMVMIEPAHTLFSNFIYRNFHHEPFEPHQNGWELPAGGRMSSANDALPWIVFRRDRRRFAELFPELKVNVVESYMPFRYLLSGGVSRPQLLPNWSYGAVKMMETLLSPANEMLGLFMKIVVQRA